MSELTEDEIARLLLLATIEGNSVYWTREVARHGPAEVIRKLSEGGYRGERNSADAIAKRIESTNIAKL